MTVRKPTDAGPAPHAPRVRALAGLTALGGSVGLALGELLGPWRLAFADNTLPQSGRLALLACLAGGALLALVAAICLWASSRAASLPTVARLLAPLGLAAFLPALLRSEGWSSAVDLAVALAVVVLISRPLFRLHFTAYDEPALRELAQGFRLLQSAAQKRVPALLRGRVALTLATAAAVSYGGYMSSFTVLNHLRFETNTWDLGQFDTAFYNTLSGLPFRCPALIRGPAWVDLATHAHFGVWLLTPFYALYPAAETLLVCCRR